MSEDNELSEKKSNFMDRLRKKRQKEPGMKGFERVVVGVDFSMAAKHALLLAQSLIKENGIIYAIHVVPNVLAEVENYISDPSAKDLQKRVAREALDQLVKWADKNMRVKCKLECVVGIGAPSLEIIKAAKLKGAQLIVLGVHGQKRSDLGILGSTVDKVVRVSDCPVICVPTERV